LRTVCIGIPIQSEPQRLRVTLDSLRSMAGDGVETVVLPDAPDDQVIDFLSRF